MLSLEQMRLPLSMVLPVLLVLLAPGGARADGECDSDPECVGFYGEGYRCANGFLGNYCVPAECRSDDDCWSLGGEGYCQYHDGEGSRCVLADEVEECLYDQDCSWLGEEAYCQYYGPDESRCVLASEEHPSDGCWDCEESRWEPPRFNSCAAARGPAARGPAAGSPLLLLLALVGLSRRRGRDWPLGSLSVGSASTSAHSSPRSSLGPGQPGTDSTRPTVAARA